MPTGNLRILFQSRAWFTQAALGGLVWFLLLSLLPCATSVAGVAMGVERIALETPVGYESHFTNRSDAVQWLQIDLGRVASIETVKLFPLVFANSSGSKEFPVRFRLEASAAPVFQRAASIADYSDANGPDPGNKVQVFPAPGVAGRYVRLTVTQLAGDHGKFAFALSKMEVWSGGRDVAEGCRVLDSNGLKRENSPLTRIPRPQGEEVLTDNPGNVIPVADWKPAVYQASAPLSGVQLGDGLFKTAMDNNIRYLLNSFSVDEILQEFYQRAGKPIPPGLRPPPKFWESELPGSCAGRFLMGAGNTLRWQDNPELRRRMNQVVDGIEACRETNGYIMAYTPEAIFDGERGAYTRSWLTQGLIAAGHAGNPKAFALLRGYYDWFNCCPYLPELLRRCGFGVQGSIPQTLLYFTPVGKAQDLQVIQRYFQENYWLSQLAKRDASAIWKYPYDRPHSYLINPLIAYFDLYRATGSKLYLDAVRGGWDLYHDNWEHVGGSIAICEAGTFPPKSYLLKSHTGELCGSVFWTRLNQRFHLLYPDQEKYVNEIEKSIYNVGLPNQVADQGITYHARLIEQKDRFGWPDGKANPICKNTCCEGQGTFLFGSLPEYIYSVAKDGLYVNLFAASTISWQQDGQPLQAQMTTQFPLQPQVRLRLSLNAPVQTTIHIRVPGWAAKEMPILVNGKAAATGKPGTYAELPGVWNDGDIIEFTLPLALKLTAYRGADPFGKGRYALEYGPILMAVVGELDKNHDAELDLAPGEITGQLEPIAGRPLHFAIKNDSHHQYIPYWEVDFDQYFTCYPLMHRRND